MEIARASSELPASPYRRILGIDFFCGSAEEAVDRMRRGGLLVVPAAPALLDISYNPLYREALLQADLALTDSSFMVLTWNLMQRDHIDRLSGLVYLRQLLFDADVRRPGNTLWVMASEQSARCNLDWLLRQGVRVPAENVYLAPLYPGIIRDPELIERIDRLQPQHVIITVGGGVQEKLGLYLKRNLTYRPAIHCVGAAIAFLSGDQVRIPEWADKLCIGWLFRSVSEPQRYVPRYWGARRLLRLMIRYRDELPPLVDRRRP